MKKTDKNHGAAHVTIPAKYGVVYTPYALADFVSRLLIRCSKMCNIRLSNIMDPACGEGSLLNAISQYLPEARLIGVDVDKTVKKSLSHFACSEIADFIFPRDCHLQYSSDYWRAKYHCIDAIIANPPWSSNRIYDKEALHACGFSLANGQYDSYELFMELAISVLRGNGLYAFIIPDSLFAPEKAMLRKWLLENTKLKIVARLGEKIFPEVFRATTVIIGQKAKPKSNSKTICYRLDTSSRNAFLNGELDLCENFSKTKHSVPQKRFLRNPLFNIDVDMTMADFAITQTMSRGNPKIGDLFSFGRGVEISKRGFVLTCNKCGCVQGVRNPERMGDTFTCKACHLTQPLDGKMIMQIVKEQYTNGYSKMWVGESVDRYRLSLPRFIMHGARGIDYKTSALFANAKLLVRKTGLGIYASIDTTNTLTNQTVYILKLREAVSPDELYYYLAFINSRVMYFYYQKMFGAAEWKSHPYLTKQVLFALPVPKYNSKSIHDRNIITISKRLSASYQRELDLKLESLISNRYGICKSQMDAIKRSMAGLPELSSISDMRF